MTSQSDHASTASAQIDLSPGGSAGLPVREVRVAIVGAGFGGLGAAIRLRQAGIENFVVLERAGDLGGTWRDNSYPGCACDVPAQVYSYSFAPSPDWTRVFPPQQEIFDYLRRTAHDHGIVNKIVFGAEVLSAQWDDQQQLWLIATSAGVVRAHCLIAATGPLSVPSVPTILGLDRFRGTVFHSARWDHEHTLTGKRVAVIGTGASAAQFVPHVQRDAAHLDVYQRTPGWVVPRPDRAIGASERRLYRRVPLLQRIIRTLVYYLFELAVIGFVFDRGLLSLFERLARRHLRDSVADPVLRAKLTPDYRLGCKRVILSNDYLPALTQPNVELITEAIAEIDETGICTTDGLHRPADTIILGTGFKLWDSSISRRIIGHDGRTLADAWSAAGPQAYVGTVVAGFPNLFYVIGPNTGLGNNSMITIIEAQVAYILAALRAMDDVGAASINVRQEVQDTFNAQLQRRMHGTVWTSGGCRSWYLSPNGVNRTLWPSFSDAFVRRLARFDLRDFRLHESQGSSPAPT